MGDVINPTTPVAAVSRGVEKYPQRHEFTVAVYTGVGRDKAMANLAKLLDAHNQENLARGFRPDMAVIPDE
jgi:alpha-D-ribose 1-methylphosphonate 5-triphosphate synthase subunit PhnG